MRVARRLAARRGAYRSLPHARPSAAVYSMQMTGYMFRSAEYRRSLLKSLDGDQSSPLLPSAEESGPGLPEVSGTIKVKLGGSMEAEVDAGAYMAELRKEVEVLRGELVAQRQANEEQGGGGLLAFVQAPRRAPRPPTSSAPHPRRVPQGLGRDKIQELTGSVSPEVLEAMRRLIENILTEGARAARAAATSARAAVALRLPPLPPPQRALAARHSWRRRGSSYASFSCGS